jgi:cytochrome c biogenesis protein CcmG, thiol:disulfide interchange protein DsbE
MNTRDRRGLILLAALVLVAATVWARHAWLVERARPVHSGESLRPLALRSTDGAAVSLRQRPGHPMLINVFASWCTPCRQEFPALSRAAAHLRSGGIDVVGIDQAEGPERALEVSQSFKLDYPVYLDNDLQTQHVLGAHVIPETVFVDADGVVTSIHSGPLDESGFLALGRDAKVSE